MQTSQVGLLHLQTPVGGLFLPPVNSPMAQETDTNKNIQLLLLFLKYPW